jgi:hypothetical protein
MHIRVVLAMVALVAAVGSHTARGEPSKPCAQLMGEVMTAHAQEGAYPVGANRDTDTGAEMMAYMHATSTRMYLEMILPAGYPPPPKECPSPFTLVDACQAPSPTGEHVTYQYWRCTLG